MKKITLFIVVFLLFASATTFSQGIRFDSTNWASLVTRAKSEKKMIFVDFYTTWCGPCKRLEKEVFPLPEVGRKFNSSFINARINAEKGEGIELASRFGITAYPSSVFIKADDESLVYKTVGYLPADKYLAETDAALEALVKDPFVEMEFEYQKGNRTFEFLTKMIEKKMQLSRPIDRELEAFFVTHWVDSFFVKTNEHIFRDIKMDVNGRAFELLMQRIGQVNQSSFYTLQPAITQIVDRNLLDAVKRARKTQDTTTLNRIVSYSSLVWTYTHTQNPNILKYQMLFYQNGSDPGKLVKATVQYMTKGDLMNVTSISHRSFTNAIIKQAQEKMVSGKVSETMNMDSATVEKSKQDMVASSMTSLNLYYAREFVEILESYLNFVTDPKAYRLAQEWSKRLVELDDNPHNLSIHAQVVFRAGDKIEGIAVQKGAIVKAKKEQYPEKELAIMTDLLKTMEK